MPKMRHRTKDCRRDPFITNGGSEPMPEAKGQALLTGQKLELKNSVKRAVLMKRAGAHEAENASAPAPDADEPTEAAEDPPASGETP